MQSDVRFETRAPFELADRSTVSKRFVRQCLNASKMVIAWAALLPFLSWSMVQPAFCQIDSIQQVEYEHQLSSKLIIKGDYLEARKHLLNVIHSRFGQQPQVYCDLSFTYIADGQRHDLHLAEVYLQQALRIDPEFGPAYRDLAWLANDSEHYQESIKLANKAMTCKKPDPTALLSRARSNHALHNLHAALDDMNNFMNVQKERRYQDYAFIANLQIESGKIDLAIKTYEKAKDLRGDWADFQIARCLELEHKTTEAISRVSQLIKKNPADDDAYRVRAQLFYKERNFNRAVADLSEAIKLAPTSSYYKERAKCYEALGQTSLAKKDLEESEK